MNLMKRRAIRGGIVGWLFGALVVLLIGCAGRPAAVTPTPITGRPASPASATRTAPPQAPPAPDYWPTAGWRVALPAEQGLDAARLSQMSDAIQAQDLALHSLLVIRHGYIVSETYFAPYRADTKHELYSCTKSFIATLVGIAIDQRAIADVTQPVADLLPGRTFKNPSAEKAAMTLAHLLTMTTGLDWTEGDPAYRAMYMSRDWVSYVMDLPMRAQPGVEFNYCSGCSHILSAIVQGRTGMSTRDFAAKALFQPLGITDVRWDTDAQGIPIGGWGLQITPRDMAKLGFLYLHGGAWEGRQIVSAQWVQTATEKHTATGGAPGYGYQWWIYPRWNAYAALGRQGQTIFVIPDLDLVVVTTAAVENHDAIFRLIEQYIVPAVHR